MRWQFIHRLPHDSQRERAALIEAACAEPDETLHLRVLADWHEDHGLPGRAEALRLAVRLRGVPFPAVPDPQCAYVWGGGAEKEWWTSYHQRHKDAALTGWADLGIDIETAEWGWPTCPRWNFLGRLPAFAPCLRAVGKAIRCRSFLARCELRACGALAEGEVWAGMRGLPNTSKASVLWTDTSPVRWNVTRWLVRLASGRAGNAVCALHAVESWQVYVDAPPWGPSEQRRANRNLWWEQSGRMKLALLRTYHRAVLREFLSARPSRVAAAVCGEGR